MILYVLTAFRWGDFEAHSYNCGVFSTLKTAQLVGLYEDFWRGGKYKLHIEEVELDFDNIMNKTVNNFWWVDPKDFTEEERSKVWKDIETKLEESKRAKRRKKVK